MTDSQLPADDMLPGEQPPPELDADAYVMDPEDAELPEISLHDVPGNNPADHEDAEQDDFGPVEGLGDSGADEPIWRRALPRVRQKVQAKSSNSIGFCLQEVRIVNETDAKYVDARGSLVAADVKHRIRDWSHVPKGSIGYFDSDDSPHGHIYENMGSGFIGSTDVPTGHWGRIKGADLMRLWHYTRAYWSPFVNDNQVGEWTRDGVIVTPEPTPAEVKLTQLRQWRRQLRDRIAEATRRHDAGRLRTLRFRLHTVELVIARLTQ